MNFKKYKSMTLAAIAILIAYFVAITIPVGWATYLIALPAFLIVGITAVARANDLTHNLTGLHWDVRRLSLCIVAGVCIMFAGGPVWDMFPSWRAVWLFWGIGGVWTTTPGMPPFWPWAIGKDGERIDWTFKGFIQSLKGGEVK